MTHQPTATPPLLDWLRYEGFLTKKLHAKSGQTQLTILEHSWEKTSWWDRYVLHLDFEQVIHREIVVSAWDSPCWYARTIVPHQTYQADAALFDRLQTESLGNLIFNETIIKRESLTHSPIDKTCVEYHWLSNLIEQDVTVLWMRLSKFVFSNTYPFYLTEIFLPGLEKYL